jgi:site-specific recombinase XerC
MMFSDWPWRHWRAEHPEKTALRLNGEQISWEQLCQRVDALASGFAQQHPLFDTELPALLRWLAVRTRWRDADSDWLFLSQKGGALSRHQVRLLLKRYGEQGGISISAYPHMLRHGCGYALADLGRDTRLIQDYLGHRNIRHTVIYTAFSIMCSFRKLVPVVISVTASSALRPRCGEFAACAAVP